MKAIKEHLKVVAFFLSALILLQGCTVYKSTNVSLEEAVNAETKVRVIKKNGERVKYYRLTFEDGQYKSIKKIGEGSVKTQIEVEKIETIQIKDNVLSTILSIGAPIIIVVGGLLLLNPDHTFY